VDTVLTHDLVRADAELARDSAEGVPATTVCVHARATPFTSFSYGAFAL
jgi:hypothetical protein